MIPGAVGLRVDQPARLGRLGDAGVQHQPEVPPHEGEDERRQEEDVEGVEARQRRAAHDLSGQQQLHQPLADQRHPVGLRGPHHHRPVGVLVPAQQLPGERQPHRQQQQDRPGQPVHLARELVAAQQVGLADVGHDQHHHRRGAPEVDPAQHAAQRRLLGDEVQAVVGVARRRDVGAGQRDAGDDLQDEGEQHAAADRVRPADPAVRLGHRVVEHRPEQLRGAEAVVDRRPDALEELHRCRSVRRRTDGRRIDG